jgi:hypothetical protein
MPVLSASSSVIPYAAAPQSRRYFPRRQPAPHRWRDGSLAYDTLALEQLPTLGKIAGNFSNPRKK